MFSILRPNLRLTLAATALAAGALAAGGAVSASADSLGAFSCTDRSGGVAGARGTVSSIRFAHHDGYDRLVIGFATSNSMPEYRLTQQSSATFPRDASGLRVALDGSAGIRAVLRNSDIVDGVPGDQKAGLPELREVANVGNFERVVSYGIGLKDAACFRVIELGSPTRLVIDIQTAADAPAAAASSAANQPAATATAVTTEASQPVDLAATGHPGTAGQPAGMPIVPILLGLLAVTAGLATAGLRRFARK
jgi:hypothetical protein